VLTTGTGYTQTEINAKFSALNDAVGALAIVGIPNENQIIPKAGKASVYDKTEIDALLAAQAPLFNAITPLLQNINSETGETEISLSTALTDSINAEASLTYVNEPLAKKANEETT
jgi:hypothetical protein